MPCKTKSVDHYSLSVPLGSSGVLGDSSVFAGGTVFSVSAGVFSVSAGDLSGSEAGFSESVSTEGCFGAAIGAVDLIAGVSGGETGAGVDAEHPTRTASKGSEIRLGRVRMKISRNEQSGEELLSPVAIRRP